MNKPHLLLSGVAVLSLASASHAALLAHDPFTIGTTLGSGGTGADGYATDARVNQAPNVAGVVSGTGFVSPGGWTASTASPPVPVTGGLTYGNLVTSGGALRAPGSLPNPTDGGRGVRTLSTAFTNSTVGTYYVSFLIDLSSTDNIYRAVEFYDGVIQPGDPNRRLHVGIGTNDFGAGVVGLRARNDNTKRITLDSTPDTDTHLVVLKMTFSATANSDSITAFFDPADLTSESGSTSAGTVSGFDLNFDRVGLARFNSGLARHIDYDEIRIGDTWADVVPMIPEPATLGLASLGALLVVGRRRSH